MELSLILDAFTQETLKILGANVTGIYLHGSAAMGCFHPEKSDIDLLVVVKETPTDAEKRQFMDMVVALNIQAPKKGIELSIVTEAVCQPFVYPTPYELHFSVAHLNWYKTAPQDYISKMHGTDKDLAAHMTILYHRGRTLCGKEIPQVFAPVPQDAYLDSLWYDIESAEEDILSNPVYVILNLCRVLAFRKQGLILSKKEGGEWFLDQQPDSPHRFLVSTALAEYLTGTPKTYDPGSAQEFAAQMLQNIANSPEICDCIS